MLRKIAYRQYGDKGPYLVFLHGYGGNPMQWDKLIEPFKDQFQVIVPNLGHLFHTHRPLLFSIQIERLYDFLVETLPQGEKVTVCGLSFGGALAWGLAIRYPELVQRLILLNPLVVDPVDSLRAHELKYFLMRPIEAKTMAKMFLTPIGRSFLESATETFRPTREKFLHRDRDVEKLSAVRSHLIAELVSHFSWIMRNEDWSYWETSLNRIIAPTLIVSSDDDHLYNPDSYQYFSQKIKNSTHQRFQEGGHLLSQTKESELIDVIRGFLDGKSIHKKAS